MRPFCARLTLTGVAALRAHGATQNEERKTDFLWQYTDLVFAMTGVAPLDMDNLTYRSFMSLLIRAGLPTITFHDLRHTLATIIDF